MFTNIGGIVCPGCMAGDFRIPHICGGGQSITQPIIPFPATVACEHCWCTKDESSYHRTANGETVRVDKPHHVCCACGSRRVIDQEEPCDAS